MKITALWHRPTPGIENKAVFALLSDGRLLYITPDTEYNGKDKNDQRIYKETGKPDMSDAFAENDKFDFDKATYFLRHFGSKLIRRW